MQLCRLANASTPLTRIWRCVVDMLFYGSNATKGKAAVVKTEKLQEKEDGNGLGIGCTIVDGLLSKEPQRCFSLT